MDFVRCVAADTVDRLGRSRTGRPRRTEPRRRRVRDDEVRGRDRVLYEALERHHHRRRGTRRPCPLPCACLWPRWRSGTGATSDVCKVATLPDAAQGGTGRRRAGSGGPGRGRAGPAIFRTSSVHCHLASTASPESSSAAAAPRRRPLTHNRRPAKERHAAASTATTGGASSRSRGPPRRPRRLP